VLDQIAKYTAKLVTDRSADADRIAIAVKDDRIFSRGTTPLATLAEQVLTQLNAIALVVAGPSLPFAELLVRRARPDEHAIIPRDTETRTFLHDIPFVRQDELAADPAPFLARLLGSRKGIIVEGVGILAVGAITVEQAYINYSSIFHATFVKYLEELLHHGFTLPGEEAAFAGFRDGWLRPLTADGLAFRTGPLPDPGTILDEVATVGGYTVQRGLVDSFFGNISWRSNDLIYISQTAASLDELPGCIDPVAMDNSSTTGITASSELAAHRRIYETSDACCILHGHPKFSVVMSMLCDNAECGITDCWRDCPHVRDLGGAPVVAGEIGAGGLAKRVPPVIAGPGRAIVYGHGVFTIGRSGFGEAFSAMVEVENWCRTEYFRRLNGPEP
jgi:ribulose-5-phosphate 4-epimerase/fuculose-1-phosphate aldolase